MNVGAKLDWGSASNHVAYSMISIYPAPNARINPPTDDSDNVRCTSKG